jgi:hypothetical protein
MWTRRLSEWTKSWQGSEVSKLESRAAYAFFGNDLLVHVAETLTQVDGAHPEAGRITLTRIAVMFELAADRKGWPEPIR